MPQLCDVQEALQLATGWNIRPTAGLMHPRDFLNGLAFKYVSLSLLHLYPGATLQMHSTKLHVCCLEPMA